MSRTKPSKPKLSPRDKLREKAQWVADKTKLPRGARIVVAITDERGDWLGVGSSTNPIDTANILAAALKGSPALKPNVIFETDGVEVLRG